jgi:CheY-like chemotaxis protein
MQSASPKIVLVIDDPTLGAITAFRLELMGYRVESVATSEAALEAVRNDPPGLIVIDLMLGGSDGLAIADRLGNHQGASGIPVMALSTSADLEAVQRAFAAGVEDYLVVPFDPAVMEEKLERWAPIGE